MNLPMVAVDSLLPRLRRMITGPLDVSMCEALLDAGTELCRWSEAITLSVKIGSLPAGIEQAVSADDHLQACNLLRVLDADGNPLAPGQHYHAPAPNLIQALVPLSDITCWYAAEPRPDSNQIPALLAQHYQDEMAAGAAAALYLQPDRPWTDPRRAAEYQARFVEGVRQAGRFRKNNAATHQVEFHNPVRRRNFF